MQLRAISTLLLLLICHAAFSQTIIAEDVVGNVEYKNADNSPWVKLRTHDKVGDLTRIRLGAHSNVTLVKENGEEYTTSTSKEVISFQVVEVRFTAAEGLFGRLKAGLYSLISEPSAKATTASYRGAQFTMLFPANGEVITGDGLKFEWLKGDQYSYDFYLRSSEENKITCKKTDLTDTVLIAREETGCPGLADIKKGVVYSWTIASPASDKGFFVRFSLADAGAEEKLKADLKKLESYKSQVESSQYALLQALCYESNKMYSAANAIYRDLRTKNPSSAMVNTSYNEFIQRISHLNQP